MSDETNGSRELAPVHFLGDPGDIDVEDTLDLMARGHEPEEPSSAENGRHQLIALQKCFYNGLDICDLPGDLVDFNGEAGDEVNTIWHALFERMPPPELEAAANEFRDIFRLRDFLSDFIKVADMMEWVVGQPVGGASEVVSSRARRNTIPSVDNFTYSVAAEALRRLALSLGWDGEGPVPPEILSDSISIEELDRWSVLYDYARYESPYDLEQLRLRINELGTRFEQDRDPGPTPSDTAN